MSPFFRNMSEIILMAKLIKSSFIEFRILLKRIKKSIIMTVQWIVSSLSPLCADRHHEARRQLNGLLPMSNQRGVLEKTPKMFTSRQVLLFYVVSVRKIGGKSAPFTKKCAESRT